MSSARSIVRASQVATALALALGSASAQTLVADGSEIRFVTRQMGVPVEGRFTRFEAQMRFDPRQPQDARVALTIDTRSIAFGAADTEAEAARPAWFHSARHPQASFVSSAVKALGGGRWEVAGTLSVKGRSRDIVVPVALAAAAPGRAVASGSLTLRRMDFALGEGEWADLSVVADEVQVRFRLQLAGLSLP